MCVHKINGTVFEEMVVRALTGYVCIASFPLFKRFVAVAPRYIFDLKAGKNRLKALPPIFPLLGNVFVPSQMNTK